MPKAANWKELSSKQSNVSLATLKMWCTLRESDQTLKNNLRTLDVKLKRTRNKPLSWKLVQPKDKTLTYRVGYFIPCSKDYNEQYIGKAKQLLHWRPQQSKFLWIWVSVHLHLKDTHLLFNSEVCIQRERMFEQHGKRGYFCYKDQPFLRISSRLHLFLKTQQIRNFIPTQNHLDFLLAYKSSNR